MTTRLLVCIVMLTAAGVAAGENLLANPGFEDGGKGWSLWLQAPASACGAVERGERYEGQAAFHVYNPGSGGANLYSASVPCRGNAVYTLSVWVRVTGGRKVQLAAWGLGAQGNTLSYALDGAAPVPSEVPAFMRLTKTFKTPEGCSQLRAHLICTGGEVWWDAVQLEEGEHSTPYGGGRQ